MSPMAATAKMSLSGSITRSRMSIDRKYVSVLFSGLSFLTLSSFASAGCVVEREPAGESHLFMRHFTSGCSKLDREAQAVDAAEILGEGWFLLDVQAHKVSADPELVEGGQLLALFVDPGVGLVCHDRRDGDDDNRGRR